MRCIKTKAVLVGLVVLAFAGLFLLLNDQGQTVLLARAQSVPPQVGCSVATLRGTYGNAFQFLDAVDYGLGLKFAEGFTPGAGLGIVTFDGRGNFTAEATVSLGGVILPLEYSGPYTVSSGCTGSMVLNVVGSGTSNLKIVLVDNGREVHTLATDAGHIAVGTMKKQ